MKDKKNKKETYGTGNESHLKNIEQIINQSDSVVYIRQNDMNWSVSYISENISRLGFMPFEFYDLKIFFAQLLHPEDVARIKAEILFASHQKKNNTRLEYRLISKSGKYLWVSDVLEIIRDEEGNIKHYQGVITDISYHKETEEKISAQSKIIQLRNEALFKANDNLKKSWDELHIAHTKLAESEEKFKVISDQALLGIIIIQDGLIKYFNKAFISLISYSEDEVFEWKEFEFLKAIFPEDKKLIQDTIKQILGTESQEEFHFEFRRITKQGEVKWLSQWSRMIKYENRRAILGTLVDVDERKKWQDTLAESENRLRAKLDFILSPDKPLGDFSITDIFEIEQLQKIQDAFAVSHDVSSIITDTEGQPITQPSNFNNLCQLIRSTPKGKELCRRSDKIIGQKARELLRPFSTTCYSCGLLDAGAPIIVGGKHVANWMIGQAIEEKLPETVLIEFADQIDADPQLVIESSQLLKITNFEQFNKVVEFLWIMAKEISALGYNNLKLARDIEERKKIEIALRESEELYRQLVQTSPDGIALVDLEGKMLYVSPRAKQLFGYPEDYDTEGLCIFNFIDPSFLPTAIANVTSILEKNISFSGTYLMVRKDHSTFSAEVNSTAINDYLGNTKGMISILRDVTERKKVEEELINAKNKAEESDKLKSAFLANMSHEIRTPMNGILGFASLLNDKETTPKLRREYAEIIDQNGKILLKLIDDILDIAKIEAGQLKIMETPFNLDQIMYEQYLLFKTLLDKKENKYVKLILTLPEPKINHKISTDQARLSQVLTNLLSNALKFTEHGSIEFGYHLEDPSTLKFFVKDTGIGLPPEKSKIIFDRFRQADESSARRYGGTGLGLTISSNLVRLMGGNIWVDSEAGRGSTFYVTLPYKPQHEDVNTSPYSLLLPKPMLYDWSNKFILIAEDEHVNYLYLQELLKSTRVNLIRAKDGKEAIALCHENSNINLILMDIKMPNVNGFTATREIKKIRQYLPIIAQSAYAMEEEIMKCKEAGCDEYISKPIDPQKLLLLIDNFFRRT
jgi:PAS domain S-box-containing protein